MQEKTLDKPINPSLNAIEKIGMDLENFGFCAEITRQQIIDEEKTHAAEILASAYCMADIPRNYAVKENDLVDLYGVSLSQVMDNGIDYIINNHSKQKGWEWELRRRQIEKNNLISIIDMPANMACVEISSTDITKPDDELKQWGYSGDTLIRISYKKDEIIMQRNIILHTSDYQSLNMLRKYIDKKSAELNSSEEVLASPQYVTFGQCNFESFVANIKNLSTQLTSSANPMKYMLTITKNAKTAQKNAWDFVNNHKLFDELFSNFVDLAESESATDEAVNSVRAGVWQLLLDEVNQKQSATTGYSIDSGVAKARALGAIFTSCGGTVTLEKKHSQPYSSFIDRYETVQMLLDKVVKIGSCSSCGSKTLMYGCGIYCKSCNQIWCKEFLNTGRQLSHKEVANKKFSYHFRWV